MQLLCVFHGIKIWQVLRRHMAVPALKSAGRHHLCRGIGNLTLLLLSGMTSHGCVTADLAHGLHLL